MFVVRVRLTELLLHCMMRKQDSDIVEGEIFTLCLKFLFSLLRTKMKQAKHLMCNIVCLRETVVLFTVYLSRVVSICFCTSLVFLFYFGFCIFYM